jgi:hypothetical protein
VTVTNEIIIDEEKRAEHIKEYRNLEFLKSHLMLNNIKLKKIPTKYFENGMEILC